MQYKGKFIENNNLQFTMHWERREFPFLELGRSENPGQLTLTATAFSCQFSISKYDKGHRSYRIQTF